MVWRRELRVSVNWWDVLDEEIVNAAWAVAGMIAKPRAGRRVAAELDTAAWGDTEGLIRGALAEVTAKPGLPELPEDELAALTLAVKRHEVQGALQALLAVRLTDAPEADAIAAREAVRLALVEAISTDFFTALRARLARKAVDPSATPPARANAQVLLRQLRRRRSLLRQVDASKRAAAGKGPTGSAEPPPAEWQLLQVHAAALAAVRSLPETLSGYFDDRIAALVATLEGRVGFAGLAQVRDEAYNARIVALLGAIERQLAALAPSADQGEAEAEFLERYRQQARARHGKLTPPDFDRRRLVTASEIYVPTAITSEEDEEERRRLSPSTVPQALNVWDLTGRLGRTVLLGDPGGGKTTAANMLACHFAGGRDRRVPFLVTLRDYAAGAGQGGRPQEPIGSSVAGHIEDTLTTLYQSPAPEGLVERLLLTGRAVVIFDGLDELLDPSRRREVSERVELFCSAYPLTPVLVTSRVVGYDQARLDETQFRCYRLGGFDDEQVAEYAGKWFASQEDMPAAEAEAKARAFLAESASITDLRANPLLLSLMCILYRGAGALPVDRAGIYARCAELLLRKWDEHRDLYRKLDADHLVEPALRYLAWWLFTREDSRTAVTERELVAETAGFLHGRAYDTEDEARAAAREFVAFCRGRMWVFSDAGTSRDGERLYGFTHRTFLEYFAACQLAAICDSPEELAARLAPRLAAGQWSVVGEIAVKVKSDATDRGADRVYASLMDSYTGMTKHEQEGSIGLLTFLVRWLDSTRPAPATVRRLVTITLDQVFDRSRDPYHDTYSLAPLFDTSYQALVRDVTGARIAAMVGGADQASRVDALTLVSEFATLRNGSIFEWWAREQAACYAEAIGREAAFDGWLRELARDAGIISVSQVLRLPGGMDNLAISFEYRFVAGMVSVPLLSTIAGDVNSSPEMLRDLTAIGHYLIEHPERPWLRTNRAGWFPPLSTVVPGSDLARALDESSGLGLAAALAVATEYPGDRPRLLPDLPMPPEFKRLFQEWAAGRIDFAAARPAARLDDAGEV